MSVYSCTFSASAAVWSSAFFASITDCGWSSPNCICASRDAPAQLALHLPIGPVAGPHPEHRHQFPVAFAMPQELRDWFARFAGLRVDRQRVEIQLSRLFAIFDRVVNLARFDEKPSPLQA